LSKGSKKVKKILISAVLALMLVAVIAVPAMAADEQSVGASVSVGEVVSITLIDAGAAGINFGPVTPPVTEQGDVAQSSGTPAIKVNVASETNVNVDISIKGAITGGNLALDNWLYSKDFAKTGITGLTTGYVGVYSDVGVGNYDFYHWIDVPAGTASGSHTVTVSYKATKH
jgi:hypothetical protein